MLPAGGCERFPGEHEANPARVERDDELIRAYARTRWSVELPGRRVELAVGRAADLRGVQLPAAVVTAYNPRSERHEAGENERAQHALRAEIEARGLSHHPTLATGTGPADSGWEEPGLLVAAADPGWIVALAGRHGQNSVLWIGDDSTPALLVTRDGFGGERAGALIQFHT
jgi:hypothetical protein